MIADPTITDEDIRWVEGVLSESMKKGMTFDDERKAVLKHWGSCDVQACPGSGKTTLLIAKILILLNKLPEHVGICVLSHTNAASDEVLTKLGGLGERLSRRPHFVGTIQQFVNQFLGVPGAIERFEVRPWGIDDDLFASFVRRRHHLLDEGVRNWAAVLPWKGRSREKMREDSQKNISQYRFSVDDPTQVVRLFQDQEYPLKLKPNQEKRVALTDFKTDIAKAGCLAFHDLFALAKEHLQKHPGVAGVLSRRFPLVFIDEMQDTHTHQNEVLKLAFNREIMVQRFGDDNQRIFTEDHDDEAEHGWTEGVVLPINRTKRLSPSIAMIGSRLSHNGQVLESMNTQAPRPHTVFVFQDPLQVLPAYAELLRQDRESVSWRIKAVGSIGKANANPRYLSLSSYFPEFTRKTTTSVIRPSFHAFVLEAHSVLKKKRFMLDAFPILLDGLAQVLRENRTSTPDGKHYSGSRLQHELKRKGREVDFAVRRLLLDLMRDVSGGRLGTPAEYGERVLDALTPMVSSWSSTAQAFVKRDDTLELPTRDGLNVYRHSSGINIQVDTVHSVKGQTHGATLLLETCYNGNFDMPDVLLRMCEGQPAEVNSRFNRNIKVAFVGLTRAQFLVCAAIHQSRFKARHKVALQELGWRIEHL